MNTKELAYWAEDLTADVEKIESLETALFQAIYRGDSTADSYEWAFIVFGTMIYELRKEMQKMTDELFNIFRSESSVKNE